MTISRRIALTRLFLAGLVGALSMRSGDAYADVIDYEYDALGRLIRVKYPNGRIVEYTYDALGNRSQVRQVQLPTGTFTAIPASIASGGTSTLSWTSANATSASIDHGIGSVTPVSGGSVNVSPTATTTYTLTLTNADGTTNKQATVTVSGFSQTIAITGTGPVSLRTLANAAGYNGAQNAAITFTIASGVTLQGALGGGICIDTGTWPTGSYSIDLKLQISGNVYGGGGNGGEGAQVNDPNAQPGGVGGDAIYCRLPINITVNSGGSVKAGGGGGGGGGGWYNTTEGDQVAGGGGGGGFPNGAGADAWGQNGTTSGGGAGGPVAPPTGRRGGAGGAGGGAATAGGNGTASAGGGGVGWVQYPPASGAAAGYAIRKNGNTVNVTNNGTITGTVS